MTKPKKNKIKIAFWMSFSFFLIAYFNSSMFKIKQINYNNFDLFIDREIENVLKEFYGKNIFSLNIKEIKDKFLKFPVLKIEKFQKILPDKIVISFTLNEELGSLVTKNGIFDLYEGGFLFPRLKNFEEKFVICGNFSEEDLKEISSFLKENKNIRENFFGLYLKENGSYDFYHKEGYTFNVFKKENIFNLNENLKKLMACPIIFEGKNISILSKNIFISSDQEEVYDNNNIN